MGIFDISDYKGLQPTKTGKAPRVLKMHQNYMSRAFEDIETIRDQMVITTKDLKYDTLVGTGLSGALVVPSLARLMGLHWAIVRKSDGTHSNNTIEGEIGRRWLFVDDGLESGRTLKRVMDEVRYVTRHAMHVTTLVGMYGYQYDEIINIDRFLPQNGQDGPLGQL